MPQIVSLLEVWLGSRNRFIEVTNKESLEFDRVVNLIARG